MGDAPEGPAAGCAMTDPEGPGDSTIELRAAIAGCCVANDSSAGDGASEEDSARGISGNKAARILNGLSVAAAVEAPGNCWDIARVRIAKAIAASKMWLAILPDAILQYERASLQALRNGCYQQAVAAHQTARHYSSNDTNKGRHCCCHDSSALHPHSTAIIIKIGQHASKFDATPSALQVDGNP